MIGRNNPFNIRNSKLNKWKGQIGTTRGFCDFLDRGFGIRAAAYLLMVSYRKQGINTIHGIVHRFAPSSENESVKYAVFVSERTYIGLFEPIVNDIQYCEILVAMSKFEGNTVVFGEVYGAIVRFNLSLAPLKNK